MANERFELILRHQDRVAYIILPLVLLPIVANLVLEEKNVKKNLLNPSNSSRGKVVFILLTKLLALHVELSIVHVWGTNFQEFIPKLFGGGGTSSLQNGFKNLLQVLFNIFGDRGCNGRDDSNGKVCF